MIDLDAGKSFLEHRQNLFGIDLGQGRIEIERAAFLDGQFVQVIETLSKHKTRQIQSHDKSKRAKFVDLSNPLNKPH